MTSSAIALLLNGAFDDEGEGQLSSSHRPPPAALRGIGAGPCSLERWLSLPSLPSRVLLVVAAGANERRVRSFLELKRYLSSLNIEIVVVSREGGGGELVAAAEAAVSSLSSTLSLIVADAAAVPLGLDLTRLQAAASLLASPSIVVSASPLSGSSACSKTSGGAEALQKTCKGLGKVSLLASARGSAVARVAAFGGENSSSGCGDEGFEAQRVLFLPASSLESAAKHSGSVRSWLRAQGSSLRALVSSSVSPSPLASNGGRGGGGPLPHASTAAGRALAATLLSRGGGWSAALPASGADAWLGALVALASVAAGDCDGDSDFEFELEEKEQRPERSTDIRPSPLLKKQHSSFSTTSSTYGAPAPPAVAAALASSSASSRRLSSSLSLLPPLSPVLKTGSSGAAGGMLRFDIPRSRVHDKLDA